jgi:hypothetical protein
VTYLGRCLCGNVQFEAEGPPIDVHYCHCSMCRRATGSAFAVLAWFKKGDVLWTRGSPKTLPSSSVARRGFCADCGTPLLLHYDRDDRLALMAGCFERADLLIPTHHYGIEGRLPWVDIGRELTGCETDVDFAASPGSAPSASAFD